VTDDEAMAMLSRLRWLEEQNRDLQEYIAAWHAWIRASTDDERSKSLAYLVMQIDQRRRRAANDQAMHGDTLSA